MKFLHCADIHLDSPLLGLEEFAGPAAGEFRLATRRAFEQVVRIAMEEHAAFVAIAGDIYDRALKGFEAPLFFVGQMERLHAAGIPVAVIHGNHDSMIEHNPVLTLPPNVTVFSAKRPESKEIIEGVWVHGQSYPQRRVSENLARHYPKPVADALNLGLLHTSLSGNSSHEVYSPCTVDELSHKGYDYWALGHIHQRQTVRDSPWIGFPGNTQGRDAGETEEKGCLIAEIDPTTRVVHTEFRATATALWAAVTVDASGAAALAVVLERLRVALVPKLELAAGRPLALRVTLTGACDADAQLRDPERLRAEIRGLLENQGEPVWLERVLVRTVSPLDTAALALQDSPLGAIVRAARELRRAGAPLAGLAGELAALRAKLPDAVRQGGPEALPLDEAQLAAWLPGVEDDLLARLAQLQAPGTETTE